MEAFKARITRHVQHVSDSSAHCATEETTKQALILPMLDILGFSPFDPTKVKAEYSADLNGIKAGERVDYALFVDGSPVMFIEAKACKERLSNHASQLARYFNATPEVKISAITNGIEWRFFTDLNTNNIMDSSPFFAVNLTSLNDADAEKLANFRADQFQLDRIKTFAEERLYVESFTAVINKFLREPDYEFIKFVAARANLTPKLTAKFLETMAPIVRQAVAAAISGMVVSGLSVPAPQAQQQPEITDNNDGDWINPDNEKIVTTPEERKLAEIVKEILDGKTDKDDIVWKDTESYFTLLYQGKVNRWLLRYHGSRKKPLLSFCIELTAQHRETIEKSGLAINGSNIILPKPTDIMKLSLILFDSLSYCQNDENFRVKKKDHPPNADA